MFPVEERLADVRRHLANNRDVVLTAPPGSGKTTCVPAALLNEPWLAGKKIVMLEPRRLAARNCATYIARKRGESVGGTVGYRVRLENRVSSATRLEIVTEGLLTQQLLADPELADVGLVIFDEFHERSLACDLSFALALEVRRALRPDLRLMVMSATLDADEVASHLGDAEIVRAEGRMFPVAVQYLGETSIAAAVARALKDTDGDILCFLPGEGEIRRALESCAQFATAGVQVLPLFGSLDRDEQDRVFTPSAARKVILSTSIAETSLTIEGVTAVVDSGLMRVPRFSPGTGMSGLVTLPLTQDRAEQRRGRAGRVREGICYRLWTEGQQQGRPKKMTPEILDADLASLALTSAAWGALKRTDLPWVTPPPDNAWNQAVSLLRMLDAIDGGGALTEHGRRMAKLPMHPRLANMLLNGGDPMLAAIIEEGVRTRETDIRKIAPTPRMKELARRFASVSKKVGGESRWTKVVSSLVSATPAGRLPRDRRENEVNNSAVHLLSQSTFFSKLALAYPDRIAHNRGNGSFRMVNGRGAFLGEDDPLSRQEFIVACELDDRMGDARVLLGCPIREDEIDGLFAPQFTEEPLCEWDRRNDRVKCVLRRKLGEMTLGEKPANADDHAEPIAAAMLDGIRIKGVENLPCWTKEALLMKERINFLSRVEEDWPAINAETLLPALAGFIAGMNKWRDLERVDLRMVMDFILAEHGHDRRELDALAPMKMAVPSGSNMTIHYGGEEPTVEVRLQECFGLMETPKVAGGKCPIVMTLLSPAHRPIQVTKDLRGFWQGAYQLVRKDMRGRYPKHYWPEDPFSAIATRRVRPPAGANGRQ